MDGGAALTSHPRLTDCLALLAGVLTPFAFAPFEVALLAPICLAALFAAWHHACPRRRLWRGWLFGVGAFGVGVSWIVHSFAISHVALPVAVLLTGLLIALLALYPALLGYLVARFMSTGPRLELLLVLPAGWTVLESLRAWLFTGFPWLELGYSQVASPLAGYLPVLGVHGVTYAVATTAGVLALCVVSVRRTFVWLALPACIWLGGVGLKSVQWTEPAGSPLRLAMVQGNIPQPRKWLAEMRVPTLERYLRLTREHRDADLVIWPETALPDFYQRLDDFVQVLDAEAVAHRNRVLFGVPWLEVSEGRVFNAVVLRGVDTGTYDKRHLVPFGEYLPFRAVLLPVTRALGVPSPDFTPGSARQPLLTVAGHPVSLSVCYEIAFARQITEDLPEARWLITLSNDAWFGASIGPAQHLQIARARAVETGRYLARSTNTGISALVAPDGSIIGRSPQFEVDVLVGEVVPMRGATPYVRWTDWPVLIGSFSALLGAIVGMRLRHRS